MRIAVVDDEKIFRKKFIAILENYFKNIDYVFCDYSCGTELLEQYRSGVTFDAIFLDIEMPDPDGMKTAKKIREYSEDVPILFLTSHTEKAMEGYEVGAFRFMPKDISVEKLNCVLNDLSERFNRTKRLILKCGNEENIISPDSVILAESDNNIVRFITADNVYSVRMRFSNAYDLLNDSMPVFVRIHRGIIVNLIHVIKYSDKAVTTDNNQSVPISKSCLDDFKDRLFDYVKKSAR